MLLLYYPVSAVLITFLDFQNLNLMSSFTFSDISSLFFIKITQKNDLKLLKDVKMTPTVLNLKFLSFYLAKYQK